jgi:aspartate kinase
MKFGGTSVGSGASLKHLTSLVRAELGREPMVVVSAASKMTDLLLGAAHGAAGGGDPGVVMRPVAERQRALLAEVDLPAYFVDDALSELSDLLRGVSLLGELTDRTLDRVAAFGELMSIRVVARVLSDAGIPAHPYPAWDMGMLTDSTFGAAKLLAEAEAAMQEAWRHREPGKVPVVTGFVGRDKQGRVTTLGRGGSDLSASLLGSGIGAEEIQIWTDVSGIMTCDPRIVPHATVIPRISFAEAAELAFFGAKVLHPRTIEPATKRGIPVRVKNTFKPEDPGTLVVQQTESHVEGPIGIAAQRHVKSVNLNSTGMLDSAGFLARVFEVFGRHSIPIDVIATSEVNVSFTVNVPDEKLAQAVTELSEAAHVTIDADRSVVCLVGEGMKTTRGLAGRIFSVVGQAGVNVEVISQGASEINVTFVVRDDECERALQALHKSFFET